MWFARLHCSEERCPTEIEVFAETLAEIETFACECGCALEISGGWADLIEDDEPADATVRLLAA